MSMTLARRPKGPVERPDKPDGGPGLPQNGDSFRKGLCTCSFSHLNTQCRKVFSPNTGECSQVTLTGDHTRSVSPWTLALPSDESVTSSRAKRKMVTSLATARKTWGKPGFHLGTNCLLHRTGICCHSVETGCAGRSGHLCGCPLCPHVQRPSDIKYLFTEFSLHLLIWAHNDLI